MSVRFGLSVPAGPPKHDLSKWIHDLDSVIPQLQHHFDSLWMTDHFFWDDDPTYEAWTAIVYMATRYPRWKVGSIVLGQSYRNPALTAKMAATLQHLSGGRFLLGIGAGWKEDEYRAYGYPFPEPKIRLEQLEDTLEIITRMWKQDGTATYHGKHYSVENAYCVPKPDPMIPIIVGGGGYNTMRLAAMYADGWNIYDAPFERYFERVAILRQHCETIGRDPASVQLSWFGRIGVASTEREALALSDGKWTRENAIVGSVQQVIDLLNQFVAGGVRYFMVEVLGIADPDTLALLLEDVLPHIDQYQQP
jgi:alkanesulfonate monooxygenase SsuD/methylene tetrahydromethanopterin reductase-like flavin-dependent oxidoreductase (luciferase family)